MTPAAPATRRLTSRKVALTAAFLALAAGGTAACDHAVDDSDASGPGTEATAIRPAVTTRAAANTGATPTTRASATTTADRPTDAVITEDATSGDDEVFYCADEDGQIVDEAECDDESESSPYYLWYSPGYARSLPPGTYLDGGDNISVYDRDARQAVKLPATGRVANGTVKTNVVGRGSTVSGSDPGLSGSSGG